jgi:hypothetical protein
MLSASNAADLYADGASRFRVSRRLRFILIDNSVNPVNCRPAFVFPVGNLRVIAFHYY